MLDKYHSHAFLGTGCRFPVTVNPVTGRFEESSYEDNIKESIYLIVMTRKGERVMRPDFGCDIHQFLFDILDYTTKSRMRKAVRDALFRWEPRIKNIEVEIRDKALEDNALEISVNYQVRTTNSPYNLVFPFYLREATSQARACSHLATAARVKYPIPRGGVFDLKER